MVDDLIPDWSECDPVTKLVRPKGRENKSVILNPAINDRCRTK